jgi:hypothetical protein
MVPMKLSIILLLATVAFSQQVEKRSSGKVHDSEAEPSLPVIDYNTCPFEGCTFGKWKVTKESAVYSSWQEGRAETGKLHPGEDVAGITGVHITRRPDKILVKKPIADLDLRPGDVILRYMYLGEGVANVW